MCGVAEAHQITDALGVGHVFLDSSTGTSCSKCGTAKLMFGGTRDNAGRIDITVGSQSFSRSVDMDKLLVGYRLNSFGVTGDPQTTCTYQLQDGPLHINKSNQWVRDEWPAGSEAVSRRNEDDVALNVAYVRIVNSAGKQFPVGAVLSVNVLCTVPRPVAQ